MNNKADLFHKINTLIEPNLKENKNELLVKIKDHIENLEVLEDYLQDRGIRKKQIILNHLNAFCRNRNIEEIEKAKSVINEFYKY